MRRQLRVSAHAKSNVDTILAWLTERSLQGAERWFEKYLDALRTLSERAEACPLAPEAATLGLELRQLLFKTRRGNTYRSLFLIDDDFIHLLAVRGFGQAPATAIDLGLVD